eukprot:6045510-Pyramimonas_sp.AAC.1
MVVLVPGLLRHLAFNAVLPHCPRPRLGLPSPCLGRSGSRPPLTLADKALVSASNFARGSLAAVAATCSVYSAWAVSGLGSDPAAATSGLG